MQIIIDIDATLRWELGVRPTLPAFELRFTRTRLEVEQELAKFFESIAATFPCVPLYRTGFRYLDDKPWHHRAVDALRSQDAPPRVSSAQIRLQVRAVRLYGADPRDPDRTAREGESLREHLHHHRPALSLLGGIGQPFHDLLPPVPKVLARWMFLEVKGVTQEGIGDGPGMAEPPGGGPHHANLDPEDWRTLGAPHRCQVCARDRRRLFQKGYAVMQGPDGAPQWVCVEHTPVFPPFKGADEAPYTLDHLLEPRRDLYEGGSEGFNALLE